MIDSATSNLSPTDVVNHVHFRGVEIPPRACRPRTNLNFSGFSVALQNSRAESQSRKEIDPFVLWLLRQGGIAADAYRATPMERRLPACLRQLRVKSSDAARSLLESEPDLLPVALNWMLLGVSSFFRDAPVFDFLEREVLPDLLRMRRGLRVLGVGVSEGQELFSIAMLLAEAGALPGSSLLGIDCRSAAIARAKAAFFAEKDLASIRVERRVRFFRSKGAVCQVSEELRSAIQWRVADLFWFPPPPSDLILFRNVAIYLEDEPMADVWRKLCFALAPGGWLVTGKAEKPPCTLPLRRVTASVYRRVEE